MNIRQEMISSVQRGAEMLGASGLPLDRVRKYLLSSVQADGGFADISGKSDLYYTSFGMEVLRTVFPASANMIEDDLKNYLHKFDCLDELDLVHLASYVRCWANVSGGITSDFREMLLGQLGNFRCDDGGFFLTRDGHDESSVHNCFMGMCIIADLSIPVSQADPIADFIKSCRVDSGGYANSPGDGFATVPTTSAATIMLLSMGQAADDSALSWLDGQFANGSYAAVEGIAIGDLLSTATAMHAMNLAGYDNSQQSPTCLRYILDRFCDDGSFASTHLDSSGDCEHIFYALLAAGSFNTTKQ